MAFSLHVLRIFSQEENMQTHMNEYPGSTIRMDRNIDRREKEHIMERIYQSQVYREFVKQWGGILSLRNIELK
jgi:hypothetical protein